MDLYKEEPQEVWTIKSLPTFIYASRVFARFVVKIKAKNLYKSGLLVKNMVKCPVCGQKWATKVGRKNRQKRSKMRDFGAKTAFFGLKTCIYVIFKEFCPLSHFFLLFIIKK